VSTCVRTTTILTVVSRWWKTGRWSVVMFALVCDTVNHCCVTLPAQTAAGCETRTVEAEHRVALHRKQDSAEPQTVGHPSAVGRSGSWQQIRYATAPTDYCLSWRQSGHDKNYGQFGWIGVRGKRGGQVVLNTSFTARQVLTTRINVLLIFCG